MMVEINFTVGKWVILGESNMMSVMPPEGSSSFFCTAQSDMASFMSCNLADHILLVSPPIEALHQAMCKFTLHQYEIPYKVMKFRLTICVE
jgi:hypothetical protein